MAVKIDTDKCIGCSACLDSCPVNALSMDRDKVMVDDATCIDCGACVGTCPTEAISM
ncbi:MAG: 4Fe-4S binding protein [Candidatus Cloacimonetes bacterium]|nr:4Fe-4S binding protein [Candidatus Cloacimonadota bacterium]